MKLSAVDPLVEGAKNKNPPISSYWLIGLIEKEIVDFGTHYYLLVSFRD